MPLNRFRATVACSAAMLALLAISPAGAAGEDGAVDGDDAGGLFFDDFNHPDIESLQRAGWLLRDAPGHPGVPGASWRSDAVRLVNDDEHPGRRLLRMTARTDGTAAGTVQAQVCQQRKFLSGTYAARIRFSDRPASGADGDPIIQTFYAVTPLRFDFDPEFSEIDWEYLPNGGWGSAATRLYSIAWQTVKIEPWQPYNAAAETVRSLDGWHTLVVQVRAPEVDGSGGTSRWFVDGQQVALHGGRNHPAAPMAISFNLWFSPTGLKSQSAEPRTWVEDIAWVLHTVDRIVTPEQVERQAERLSAARQHQVDTVGAASPPLASSCSF